MLGGFGLSEKRNRMIDYTYTVIINSMALMIPKPKSQTINYVVVIWEPFQTQVITKNVINLNRVYDFTLFIPQYCTF